MNQIQIEQRPRLIGQGFQRCGCVKPLATSDAVTADFVAQIKAGYIHPPHMADVIYAMHAALVDRFPAVGLWLPTDLEQVADSVLKAERIQERQEQDYPEAVAA